MNNEQWLTDGKCELCRRQKYCSKPCRVNKIARMELAKEMMLDAYKEKILEKTTEEMKKIKVDDELDD